ncbi:hypothetical protein [Xanthomonas campestris]|uniref:hypothetical protein n=1 Tax=Xanthomonas campestris TaxID=339 RepID=UPI0023781D85|nr:hypothetical protein [Xanthomonas campestris]
MVALAQLQRQGVAGIGDQQASGGAGQDQRLCVVLSAQVVIIDAQHLTIVSVASSLRDGLHRRAAAGMQRTRRGPYCERADCDEGTGERAHRDPIHRIE